MEALLQIRTERLSSINMDALQKAELAAPVEEGTEEAWTLLQRIPRDR